MKKFLEQFKVSEIKSPVPKKQSPASAQSNRVECGGDCDCDCDGTNCNNCH